MQEAERTGLDLFHEEEAIEWTVIPYNNLKGNKKITRQCSQTLLSSGRWYNNGQRSQDVAREVQIRYKEKLYQEGSTGAGTQRCCKITILGDFHDLTRQNYSW